MQNQRFNEDQVELDAHFAERVQAYIELGETPQQAHISATEKFGETETVARELRQQKHLRSPLAVAFLGALIWFALTTIAFAAMVSVASMTNLLGHLPPFISAVLSILALLGGVVAPALLAGRLMGYWFPSRRGAALVGIVLPGLCFMLWMGILTMLNGHSDSLDSWSWLTILPLAGGVLLSLKRGAQQKRCRR
jgi:hypothetical protein